MTRPIYEPTEQRQIAALGYDKNQLFRRPRPLGDQTFPWAILRDGTTTVPFNAASFPVPFELATKNFDPGDTIFSWAITDAGDPGVDRFELQLNLRGLYFVDIAVVWNDTGTGTGTCKLDLNPSSTYNPFGSGTELNAFQVGDTWLTGATNGTIQASAVQRVTGHLSANTNCVLQPRVTLSLAAGDRDLDGIYLKAVFIEEYGDEADWVVENV